MTKNGSHQEVYLVSKDMKKHQLNINNPTTIGREKYNDIVLSNLLVSRQHVVITWQNGHFIIKDMKSQNGTFVNENRIDSIPLKHRDVINISGYEFIVQVASYEEIDTIMAQNQMRIASKKTIKSAIPMKFNDSGFTGKLESLAIDEIVQVVNQSQKTGVLTIDHDKDEIKIYFDKGEIVHAIFKNLTGFDAVIPILQFSKGQFEFKHGIQSPERTITKSTVWILLEAHRQKDETDRG